MEPYEIAFKTRKDGAAREYLYAYDTTGGRTSGPGIKAFVPGKTEAVANTSQRFEPRFEVEIRKAGGSESAKVFAGRSRVTGAIPRSRSRGFGRRRSTSSFGITYRVMCPFCQKRFTRNSYSTRLNPHKDRFGNRCPGRVGYPV